MQESDLTYNWNIQREDLNVAFIEDSFESTYDTRTYEETSFSYSQPSRYNSFLNPTLTQLTEETVSEEKEEQTMPTIKCIPHRQAKLSNSRRAMTKQSLDNKQTPKKTCVSTISKENYIIAEEMERISEAELILMMMGNGFEDDEEEEDQEETICIKGRKRQRHKK